ncbi:TonB-dependent receptor [Sinimarinibacterium sp. NLF-5-8]|uniref:TonB-dependent receptor family protein n=1 Tax=Sinimarinibacterium sp. NLF-5-8 TaxID=2698684 RepID=UPI00137BBB91|nr:TonB-dependent receptor [Sinimarinibacterium sp. NLF-5-8]QHS10325.1 TonB-dependent receptor [Sinimarinibacterium sp. NLF-5-8]
MAQIQTAWTLAATIMALPLTGAAQTPPTSLAPIEVSSPRVEMRWSQTPAALSAVLMSDLQGDPQLALDEVLMRVPGVYAQNRYNLNQGLRLSIRGFGSRASFGIRGIRVQLDDVPLTMPDGQTDLDALDMALLTRAEVLRGPTSALYGNGAGGVFDLHTRFAPEGRYGRVDIAAGELGEQRWRAEGGWAGEGVSGVAAVARRLLEGHRDNMAADSTIGTGRMALTLGKGVLDLSVHTLNIEAADPGALTRAETQSNPHAANAMAVKFASSEAIEQQRASAKWSLPLTDDTDLRVRGWGGQRDFANSLPFAAGGQTTFERTFGGAGAQLDHRFRTGAVDHHLSVGGDWEQQSDLRRRYNNAEGGVRGPMTLEQNENARGLGAFVVNQMHFASGWLAALGARWDQVRLDVSDRFLADGDDSGNRQLGQASFNLGLGYQLRPDVLLFTRWGSGFETPTNNELANPEGGGFNPDVGASSARNHELGIKLERARVRAELVGYWVRNTDELVRFELEDQPGRSFFRNAGATDRKGFEASAQWQMWPNLTLSGAYGYNDYHYRHRVAGQGIAIAGIPRQQLFAEVAWRLRPAWLARVQAQAVDRLYAEDANAERVPGYVVTNARLMWAPQTGMIQWRPYVAVNNLFDRSYTDNLRVNAAAGRFYEPAAGRVLIGGISVVF